MTLLAYAKLPARIKQLLAKKQSGARLLPSEAARVARTIEPILRAEGRRRSAHGCLAPKTRPQNAVRRALARQRNGKLLPKAFRKSVATVGASKKKADNRARQGRGRWRHVRKAIGT